MRIGDGGDVISSPSLVTLGGKFMKTDTIAAIATAMTNSGIGIVRMSGEDSFEIIQKRGFSCIRFSHNNCLNTFFDNTSIIRTYQQTV